MATEAAATHGPTAGEYIVHHLGHLNTTGHVQTSVIDFSVINLDTLTFSVLMGVLGSDAERSCEVDEQLGRKMDDESWEPG